MRDEMHEHPSGDQYFSSPQEAIPRIAELLRQEDFRTLARYYDLSSSDIPLSEMESGSFFVRTERPEVAHPAGFWRYKHPFPPGFEYDSIQPAAREGVYVVSVRLSIDQGMDSPNQEALSRFYMIKSDHGWQLLPDPVIDVDEPEVPL